MAITFQYGPVASAIGLATKAGQGQRQQDLFNQGLQFNQLINSEQARLDQKNANEVSRALGVDEFNAHLASGDREFQAQQQQQSANNQLRQQELQSHDQENTANRAIAQQNANTQAKNADTTAAYRTATTGLQDQKYQTQQDALNNLNPDQANMIRANGHLPGQPQQDQTAALTRQYRLLVDEARKLEADRQASAYDENDLKKIGSNPSTTVPGAIAGLEERYSHAADRLKFVQKQMEAAQQQLENPASAPLGSVDPHLGQQVVKMQQQQGQQQSAPQQPRITATATNPKTGEKIGFDANTGRWVKI